MEFYLYDSNDRQFAGICDSIKESNPTAEVLPVKSWEEFRNTLKWCVGKNQSFDSFYFYTHGAPGRIRVGNDFVTKGDLFFFRTVAAIVKPGARVLFIGCNLGFHEGLVDTGLEFMEEFGRCFLAGSGGIVGASETLVLKPAVWHTDMWVPWGEKVRLIRVDKNGRTIEVKSYKSGPL